MNNEETTTPQVIEMEKFVLGSLLLKDGAIIPDVAAILDSDDFYRPEHRLIYNSILKLYHSNIIPNILSLVEDLRQSTDEFGKNLLDKFDIAYVLGITEIAHTTAYSIEYAKKIKETSDQRKLIQLAEKIIYDSQTGSKSPLDIIADTTNAFNEFKGGEGEDFFNVADYLKGKFAIDVADDFKFFDRKSGFSNIDEKQHWKPGLYILGATPACGKTTFAWQLLEQFAENGETCFFCSYEMTQKELTAKTLARRLFINNRQATLTAADILNGGFTNGLTEAAFFDNENINFVVKKFSGEDVNKLIAILRPRIKYLERPPIVCIDYIQRLIPRDRKAADTRALMDDALFKLKDFANETNSLILGISTFNRTNYNLPPSFENFKESGGIEYTADVVFAMQLDITNKLSGENVGDIRNKIEGAKLAQPREISFKCLKNRYGNNFNCFFHYFSAHDFFEPCQEFDFIANSESVSNKKPEIVFE